MSSELNPTSVSYKVRVGLTIGDPSGIGPAITLKALACLEKFAEFTVIGDACVLAKAQSAKRKTQGFKLMDMRNVNQNKFAFGKIKAEYGRASIEYLDAALELFKDGRIDCLVTCPISKEAINRAGFIYSGHTEYFAQRLACPDTVMMLLNKDLKFSLVTRHIPFKSVPSALSAKILSRVIKTTYQALKELFLLKAPRLIVCGLNPHASDNGLIGKEENRIIKPALRQLLNSLPALSGPLPAEVAIRLASLKNYDCVIALYHDQAMIPLKLSGDKTGVNLTLGLPFIRTSPLHGTAFDIAQDAQLADPASLIAAIRMAVRCTRNLKKV